MAIPPDDFFRKQERELARYTEARIRNLLRMLEDARRDIQVAIADADSWQGYRVRNLTRQIDAISGDLSRRLQQMPPASPDLAAMVKAHLDSSIGAISELEISIAFDVLNTDTLMAFSQANLSKVVNLTMAQKDTIKSALFNRVGIKGENPAKVARRLAGQDGEWSKMYGRLENILRTETSDIYNQQSLDGIRYANDQHALGLNKRIVETIDGVRNHPISLVLNGMVAPVDGFFKVPVSAVVKKAAILKRKAGGVFWPVVDGHYVGQRLPAHYNERGIVVPTQKEVDAPPLASH